MEKRFQPGNGKASSESWQRVRNNKQIPLMMDKKKNETPLELKKFLGRIKATFKKARLIKQIKKTTNSGVSII